MIQSRDMLHSSFGKAPRRADMNIRVSSGCGGSIIRRRCLL